MEPNKLIVEFESPKQYCILVKDTQTQRRFMVIKNFQGYPIVVDHDDPHTQLTEYESLTVLDFLDLGG